VFQVFDREEKRQQRLSASLPVEATNLSLQEKISSTIVVEQPLPPGLRDCPSRQSSWSSYDSAVILRESPSRQSSWGSADTKMTYGTLPSRNSSWGSYDLRQTGGKLSDELEAILVHSGGFSYDREAIPWHPGTVKRTKQKLESESSTKRACPEVVEPLETSTVTIKLQKSTAVKAERCPSPKDVVPQLVTVKVEEPPVLQPPPPQDNSLEGVVKSLKKEFEAKIVRIDRTLSTSSEPTRTDKELAKSEPSSPDVLEDLSVKLLVNRFEVNNKEWPVLCRSVSHSPPGRQRLISDGGCPKRRSSPASLCNQPPVPQRKSSYEATAGNNVIVRSLIIQSGQLPPPQPVLGIAKCKKQQGKTHPLARLTSFAKGRHINPVFNTM
jgi:protein phosphatase slingshot